MSDPQQSVVFVGLGYIGLPTAVTLANSGVRVKGVDVNEAVVEKISRGEVTIVEPGLETELKRAVDSGQFTASTDMQHGETFIIAVPTPFKDDYEGDTSYIEAAGRSIAPLLVGDELVILESTSPPQTTKLLGRVITQARPDLTVDPAEAAAGEKKLIHMAYCPERILPGKAMEELVSNDRIIGGMTPEAAKRGKAVYATFCEGELLETDDVTAEMAKLTENSFRDVNIAFANELSLISDKLGIDVWELIELANHHPRVNILQPGPGVGGHCIAVDPWFIVSSDRENSNLIRTAREVNDGKPQWVIGKVDEALAGNESPVVAALGLAFKANIDDLRESPALNITRDLAVALPHASVLAVEPNVSELPGALSGLSNVELTDYRVAIDKADVVLVLVDHEEFEGVPAAALAGKTVVDTKGLWR